jgi:hypothetical protein
LELLDGGSRAAEKQKGRSSWASRTTFPGVVLPVSPSTFGVWKQLQKFDPSGSRQEASGTRQVFSSIPNFRVRELPEQWRFTLSQGGAKMVLMNSRIHPLQGAVWISPQNGMFFRSALLLVSCLS